ncbi:ATP-grasp fold amidoligase family protein [Sphingobacterium haloxyli]|uniref:Glycosyl transferase n=1 Tax=Sphingobacterium haloxyli TaxID=2100533 RepID=A0A2S9J266_9SPHI|nr:ATP-grasp fold amidoligase family protein [Sphingobacterium haloxyli]PRD46849.1 glycosyl transferase [Sphingobacterium haloxyli]
MGNTKLFKRLKDIPFVYHSYLNLKNSINNALYTDYAFCRKTYKKTHGEYPNIDLPQTFSEKLLWSMFNHRDQVYIQCADKFEVRDYVKRKIGEEYLINSFGVFDHVDSIDFRSLPNQFVIKATHGSGWNIIVEDKDRENISNIRKRIRYWLKTNYFEFNREWPYKYMKKRVICEEFIGEERGTPPEDYKFFCFNGEPKLIQLDIGRFTSHKRNVYDTEWSRIGGVEIAHEQDENNIYPKPKNLKEMIDVARKLSEDFNHVRIDLYNVQGKVYFGEMTFFHGAGSAEYFRPKEFHLQLGEWFDLPSENINSWMRNDG